MCHMAGRVTRRKAARPPGQTGAGSRSRAFSVANATPSIDDRDAEQLNRRGRLGQDQAHQEECGRRARSIRTIVCEHRGRRGSDTEISSHPSTCEDSARSTSHACASRSGAIPVDVTHDDLAEPRRTRPRSASLCVAAAAPAGRRTSAPLPPAQDARVGDRREDAVDHSYAEGPRRTGTPLPTTPKITMAPKNMTGIQRGAVVRTCR